MEQIKELAETKQRCLSNMYRIDGHDEDIKEIREEIKQLYTLNTELKLLTQTVANMSEILGDIKATTSDLAQDMLDAKNAPHKNKAQIIDRVIGIISTIVISGLAAFILNALAPNIF